ncbi:MAG: HEPN domain-containing protein [Thermodesulfobacteriota bacterium]|nr:HEPN domain-containing protein [Thermodesulfobacteriota bacterium]
MKGFIAFKEEEITKTHDLVLLNKMCGRHDEGFKEIDEDCLLLTNFGVNMRFPFHLEINRSDMKTALSAAKKINIYILKKIESAIDIDE